VHQLVNKETLIIQFLTFIKFKMLQFCWRNVRLHARIILMGTLSSLLPTNVCMTVLWSRMAASDLQRPASVWMPGFRFGARGPFCLQSNRYRAFFHWKKCSQKRRKIETVAAESDTKRVPRWRHTNTMRYGIKCNPPGRHTARCTAAINNEISRLQLISCELLNRSTKLIAVTNYGILMLYIKICNNKPPHLCRNMLHVICIINGVPGRAHVGWYVDCNNRHSITKNKDKQLFCGHNILTEGVFVTQLPSNARISVCCNVGVTTDCRSMSVYAFFLTQINQNIL
jgi:hypothetical protein